MMSFFFCFVCFLNKITFGLKGTLREGGYTPNTLYNIQLTAYDPINCKLVENTFNKNWNSQICAGLITGGKDTCQGRFGLINQIEKIIFFLNFKLGDSGGGLYAYDTKLLKYVVGGIVSYGYGCARPNYPGYK